MNGIHMISENIKETEYFEFITTKFYSSNDVVQAFLRKGVEFSDLDLELSELLQEDGSGAYGMNIINTLRIRGYRAYAISSEEERHRDNCYFKCICSHEQ